MPIKGLRLAATCAVFLALFVVMLGAYTRLTDAGLGCPDWPGCYGRMVLPLMENLNPQVETVKAWTEMAHRYAAGTLGLLILGLAWGVLRGRLNGKQFPLVLPLTLLLLLGFQAALGMWTVTLKLLPIVVMGHLLGGMLIFTCLSYFRWQLSAVKTTNLPAVRVFVNVGIVLVFCQIALGGWVSSNYAGIACIGFPRCNGQWFPLSHLVHAFNVFSSIGANYQGGLLDNETRVTIQVIHRLGAYVVTTYVLGLSGFILTKVRAHPLRLTAMIALGLVAMQFMLGVINVLYLLPLWSAVAHNGLAALLLASMVSMRYFTTRGVAHGG